MSGALAWSIAVDCPLLPRGRVEYRPGLSHRQAKVHVSTCPDFTSNPPPSTYLTPMDLLPTVKDFIQRENLVPDTSHVLVALSGGPDSVALLHLLTRLRRAGLLSIEAVYINHGLRRKAAREEEAACQQLCDKLKVPLMIVRENVKKTAEQQGLGIEEAGREVRYAVFSRLAEECAFDRVALGHHADDQVETILFRLLRGTGPTGLTGMPTQRGVFVRPLLEISRDQILDYLREQALPWSEDRSNRSLRYTRNAIRHRLLPLARELVNPRVGDAILTMAANLRLDEAYLDETVDHAWRKLARFTPGGKLNLDLPHLLDYHEAICRRLLRRCVRETCGVTSGPDKEVIDRLIELAKAESGRISLPDTLQAEAIGNRLWLYQSGDRSFETGLEPGHQTQLDWPKLTFRVRQVDRADTTLARKPRSRTVEMDADKLRMPLTVRSILPGDRFRPLGLAGSKKVGDLLTDRKVPRPVRDELPVLCDRSGIVWVVGQEIAHRVRVTSTTKGVMRVECRVRRGSETGRRVSAV
ncbi:tRNA lysidine(34) synthetase TilS [candidate division GN15 bacterium]|nr:tRNA lysidine(34) synthetase TilS [candidate division GN15 bacterium]